MKSFIIALVILLLVFSLVIFNALYVSRYVGELISFAETLPTLEALQENGLCDIGDDNMSNGDSPGGGASSENGAQSGESTDTIDSESTQKGSSEEAKRFRLEGMDKISVFCSSWEKHRPVFSIFIVYDYIYNIQACIDQMVDFYDGEYYTDYSTQRRMLITALNRLKEVEEFSADTIL